MTAPRLDAQVLESARHGDPKAWESLWDSYHAPLRRLLDGLIPADVRASVDSGDILNDTCFEAYQRLSEFVAKDEDAIWKWLATIARHRTIDVVRTQRRLKRGGGLVRMATGQADEDVAALLHDLAVYYRTPSLSAIRLEVKAVLEASIERLPKPLKDALKLHHLSGLSFRDVAAKMSRTERAVQQLCVRAMQELRREFRSTSFPA